MSHSYQLALKPKVVCHEQDGAQLLFSPDGNALRLAKPSQALKTLLTHLMAGGMTVDALCEVAALQDQDADPARTYYALATFEKKGFVDYTLAVAHDPWATLEPTSPAFCLVKAVPGLPYRLSRFAYLRRQDDNVVVESALGHGRLVLHHSRAAAAVTLLAMPHTALELAALLGMDDSATTGMLNLLCSAGVAFACAADGKLAEDDSPTLQPWEFHDLLFHSRSRAGRHGQPWGGTFRFRDTLPHPAAVKPAMSERRVALYQPDMVALAASDSPFSLVSESRQSIRMAGEQPLSVKELGEFLYRSARAKSVNPTNPAQPASYESSWRVCASGGAIHELELYLTVSRCDGIAPGLYHYDPLGHSLEHLADLGPTQHAVLADGCAAAGLQTTDVLITLTARFQRTQWKYQSIAYALILKNVGALYQQMYLVATAMKLAPCALGGGNSDQFAKAAGLDYYAETSVGEFLLSSRPNADV